MDELTTSIDIDAPAETVWQVLVDFERYPEWNDYTRIDGEAVAGTTLAVAPGPQAGRMPTFKPTVLRADDGELRWRGHLFVRGLFDGEHRFVVEDLGDGRSRLTQAETFTGILVWPINRLFGDDTERNFHAVNQALKTRAESMRTAEPTVGATTTVERSADETADV
ncbi:MULTISPECIES: SRPBCC domain-containing protein [Haloferax]|uniref:SRPBCC domain-containing protein n=2 Tax=Haloferax TaxID=2251 RepID=A0A6G1Z776_9EURY|nr:MULTISPECIES: SRPBCC domain-containing protein [Haloferax]KAB1185074.1 SRPBCC domain-containing protein [Haloferax sp. CBA1149]MRW82251.1 SRPBCC domain-containing protein [Haloferax marinisediminis]